MALRAAESDPDDPDAEPYSSTQRVWERLGLGPRALGYRALCVAWLVASVARLTLLEERHGAGWWVCAAALVVASAGLVRWGGRIWWTMAAVAVAVPLVALGDWMTQSVVMLLIATVGAATAAPARDGSAVRATAHALVVAVYCVAAFHKLNTGFLDPAVSCGAYGVDKLARFVGVSTPGPARAAAAAATLSVELTIPLLLVFARRAGVALGLLFHVPLTLVLAPAFAFVMGVGYAGALDDRAWTLLLATARRRWPLWTVAGAVALTAVVAAPGGDVIVALKAAALVAGAALVSADLVGDLVARRRHGAPPGAGTEHRTPPRGRDRHVATAAVAVLLASAITPYLGTQFQHSGAMLSNLRIDSGCWNHLVVPESVRLVDPYLRVDEAHVGPARPSGSASVDTYAEGRERVLLETLWAPSSLRAIRRNWCSAATAPIHIRGTFRGQTIDIADVCDASVELPHGVGLFGGDEWFPTFLKLQKNLSRTCPSTCVH